MRLYGLLFLALVGCSSAVDAPDDSGAAGDDDQATGDALPGGDDAAGDTDAPTYAECLTTPLPSYCDATATTLPGAGEPGSDGPFTVVVETFANPDATAPADVSVYRPEGATNAPVVFFSHAYGATVVAVYDLLLRNLASNGLAVVYVPYSTLGVDNAGRYAQLWSGFSEAADRYASSFDLTRVAFAGHSFGGGATPEMARRGFVEQGWGANGRFLFIMAPWYSWGTAYDTLPPDTHVVVQVYADDAVNDHTIAVHDIWEKLPAGIDKLWMVVSSDVCDCGLVADHTTPLATPPTDEPQRWFNGDDAWGVQRRIVAMARWVFDGNGAARAVARGEDAGMGNWVGCDGRAVRPLATSSTPQTHACHDYTFAASDRCAYADDDYACGTPPSAALRRCATSGAEGVVGDMCFLLTPTEAGLTGQNADVDSYALRPQGERRGLLVVYMNGSGGSPSGAIASPEVNFYGTARDAGLNVLGVSYRSDDIIGAVCSGNDGCFEPTRLSVLTGVKQTNAASAMNDITTDEGLYARVARSLVKLAELDPDGGWADFVDMSAIATPVSAIKWDKVIAAGHSQGGGHAALVGKLHAVDRVIALSSPCDAVDGNPATWLSSPTGYATSPATKFYGLDAATDGICPAYGAVWDALGIATAHQRRDAAECGGTASGHGASIKCEDNASIWASELE